MGYGEIIRSTRKKARLTQEQLAEKICVSRSAIYAWEREKYPPTDAKKIASLESALGLKSGELFSLIYSNPPEPVRDTPK
jgi:transcriptional regulator with XRE-family HTH domain